MEKRSLDVEEFVVESVTRYANFLQRVRHFTKAGVLAGVLVCSAFLPIVHPDVFHITAHCFVLSH